MYLTHRRSGWRFQIRVPRDLEGFFGVSILRLNIGPVGKRDATRISRLLAGHVESVFLACRMGARMTKDELIEQLQEMLIGAMDAAACPFVPHYPGAPWVGYVVVAVSSTLHAWLFSQDH